jgi:hypothetical protein
MRDCHDHYFRTTIYDSLRGWGKAHSDLDLVEVELNLAEEVVLHSKK